MSPSDERWAAKIKVLKEMVNHHIKEEESKLFKVAQRELENDAFPTIMDKFEKQSDKIRENLS